MYAGGGDSDFDDRRGEGGYEGEARTDVAGRAGGGEGGTYGEDFVRTKFEQMEKRIKELEEKLETKKQSEGSRFELVNMTHLIETNEWAQTA